jgi:glycine cleavage system H protein
VSRAKQESGQRAGESSRRIAEEEKSILGIRFVFFAARDARRFRRKGVFMYPEENVYTKDHEWLRLDGDIGTVGITDFAQSELGDIVYIELPQVGKKFEAGDVIGTIESVKAVSEIYAPVSGEVTEVNEQVTEEPATVNEDPHGEAWMIKMRIADKDELKTLLSAADYEKYTKEEAKD